MKVTVIGAGLVGRATGNALSLGADVRYYDIKPERSDISWDDLLWSNVVVIVAAAMRSVQEDSRIVNDIVGDLVRDQFVGTIVVRTTVTPGTYKELDARFGVGHRYLSWPEFLRADYAAWDAQHPYRLVFGAERYGQHQERFIELVRKTSIRRNVDDEFRLTPTQAEIVKIAANVALGVRISFWNELEMAFGSEISASVVDALAADQRLASFGIELGRPYGGMCLPKDNAEMERIVGSIGVAGGTETVNKMYIARTRVRTPRPMTTS